jgi:hypothetical protein
MRAAEARTYTDLTRAAGRAIAAVTPVNALG